LIHSTTSFTIDFTTENTIPAFSKIRLTLPEGYTFNDPKCEFKGKTEEFLETKVTHSKRDLICIGLT